MSADDRSDGRAGSPTRRGNQNESFFDGFRHALTGFGAIVAHPIAFTLVPLYAIFWVILSPGTLEWHAVTTLATLIIALLIQRSTHRDTQAIHAKLDELLRSHPAARTELSKLDGEEPEDIEAFRKESLSKPAEAPPVARHTRRQ